MKLYCGMDLHSNNTYVHISDEQDRAVFSKRSSNNLESILDLLQPWREEIQGIVIESTFNWYWLVDGLTDHGYPVQLANPGAMTQYSGLKYAGDRHAARWMAKLLRLGLIPNAYIYPPQERAVRDLLRKRSALVGQRTANLCSFQNLLARSAGQVISGEALKKLNIEQVKEMLEQPDLVHSAQVTLTVITTLNEQIHQLEKTLLEKARLRKDFQILRTVPGIGKILALTIAYETGSIQRFPGPGNYASYCRCVQSKRTSNKKDTGSGNRKNGNRYLSWAFSEASYFARRFEPRAQRFYDRKAARTKPIIASRALAHKLARACFFILRDQVPYNRDLLFQQ